MNPKGSHIYGNYMLCVGSTPSGSYPSHCLFYYKYLIPSGLFQNPRRNINILQRPIAIIHFHF